MHNLVLANRRRDPSDPIGVVSTDIWAKMKATDVAARSPPKGKDHHAPEHYFEDVLEGARLIEGLCSKDMIFE